jgi:hypothetical protein
LLFHKLCNFKLPKLLEKRTKISRLCPFNGLLDVVVDVPGLVGEEGEDSLSDGLAPPEGRK